MLEKSNKIFLTGFMTCGKSTLGPILANMLGWNFYDLDKEIVERERATVVEIFKTKGEEYFRTFESNLLKEISEEPKIVVSLGGGTIINNENLNFVKESGLLVYLRVSSEILFQRLKNKTDRPLLRDIVLSDNKEIKLKEKIEKLLNEREPYYLNADLVFEADDRRLGLTADALYKKILRYVNE
jgi:shikimate kinase